MKKTLNQFVMILGFIVVIIGTIMANVLTSGASVTTFTTVNVAAIFAVTCIFAANSIIKNIGYGLAAFVASFGIGVVAWVDPENLNIGEVIAAFGMIIMGVAALLYALIYVLRAFGFVKKGVAKEDTIALDELGRYKEMLQDNILSDDEFDGLKQKVLATEAAKAISIDDLKKWKKLLDQQVITEAEFKQIKENIFNK